MDPGAKGYGVAQAWTDLPLDQPIVIEGPSASALTLSIEPLPTDAPTVITYEVTAPHRPVRLIDDLLARLDRVALELFPAWLPEAAAIDDAAGAGAVAVRSMALRAAATGCHYGPFLADLAERALLGTAVGNRFRPEIRARELAKVIAQSFGRQRTAILMSVPAGLTPDNEQALVAAGRWLADNGGYGIWLAGNAFESVDVLRVPFSPPSGATVLTEESATADEPSVAGAIGYPAIAGQPHPASQVERSLEDALGRADWAVGREWNQLHQAHPLTNPVRVDLLWRTERCIVEIDGQEHRHPLRYANDRQRDVLLQLAGYAVLRFTNMQVTQHRDLVMSQIRQFLDGRRAEYRERAIHE